MPWVYDGDPIILGTLITVRQIILLYLLYNCDIKPIMKRYPNLTRDDINEAIQYARKNKKLYNVDIDNGIYDMNTFADATLALLKQQ
ncbi:MAG: DUF433 domain-containing protein [Nitrososphaerales archaeon]